jgi:hypothetical protein
MKFFGLVSALFMANAAAWPLPEWINARTLEKRSPQVGNGGGLGGAGRDSWSWRGV